MTKRHGTTAGRRGGTAFGLMIAVLVAGAAHMVAAGPERTSAQGPLDMAAPDLPLAPFDRRDEINAPQVDFVRVADLDGDGDIDFLGVEPGGNNLKWWANGGDGTGWVVNEISRASNQVEVVSPGDFDGDGDIDFLALAPDRNNLGIWYNDGTGQFTRDPAFSMLMINVLYVEAADVDGDGLSDFFAVLGAPGGIDWYHNTRQAAQGTGLLDAFGSLVGWARAQPGPLTFDKYRVAAAAQSGPTVRLDAGDIDGDGYIDIATADPTNDRVLLWRQVTAASAADIGFERIVANGLRETDVIDVAIADVSGDGRPDILAARMSPYRVYQWVAQESGTYVRDGQQIGESPSANRPWHSLDSAEINGDGAVDFVVSELGGRLCWYENPLDVPGPTPGTSTASPTATSTATASATATGGISPTPTPTGTESGVTATPTGTDPSPTASPTPTQVYLETATNTPVEPTQATTATATETTWRATVWLPHALKRK